jgi:hypothetical protein
LSPILLVIRDIEEQQFVASSDGHHIGPYFALLLMMAKILAAKPEVHHRHRTYLALPELV